METRIQKTALIALQWTLGLTLVIQAALFAFARASAHAFSKTGLPDWIRVVEAWGEMLTAFLFLIPGTVVIGGLGPDRVSCSGHTHPSAARELQRAAACCLRSSRAGCNDATFQASVVQ